MRDDAGDGGFGRGATLLPPTTSGSSRSTLPPGAGPRRGRAGAAVNVAVVGGDEPARWRGAHRRRSTPLGPTALTVGVLAAATLLVGLLAYSLTWLPSAPLPGAGTAAGTGGPSSDGVVPLVAGTDEAALPGADDLPVDEPTDADATAAAGVTTSPVPSAPPSSGTTRTAAPAPRTSTTSRTTAAAPLDKRWPTCKSARAHGLGPYRRGVDQEYAWYPDPDGDGVACA